MLQSMELQRVRQDWATELIIYCNNFFRKLAKSKLKEVSFHQSEWGTFLEELYLFLRAAVTKYNKGGGFKQQKLTQLLRLKIWNQGVFGTRPSLLALGAYPFFHLRKYTGSYWQSEHVLSCPHHSTHVAFTLCVITSSSLWGSLFLFLSSYRDSNHRVWAHLIQYDFILSHYICTDFVSTSGRIHWF